VCGLAGVFGLDGPLDPRVARVLPAMTGALRHRGPDGEGFFLDDRAGLGHRRLSIIDRAGGGQPISNEDGTRWIVFNGEIYNHRKLRGELIARGHVFRTTSDTEAILHAYEEFGPGAVDRLDGMFAFAIYDQTRKELFIARDRVGKKPLFYAELGGVLHFASQIHAFYPSPLWRGRLDLSALEGYLSLGYFLAPHTAYEGVRKLPPGYWLRAKGGRVETRQYWDVPTFDDDRRGEADLVEDLEALMRDAVESRLESEVPLGAFLSGGIDSGLVVSFMAGAVTGNLVTTTVGFGDRAHDELAEARRTAERFGASHHEEIVRPVLGELLDPLLSVLDEPLADSSAIPTFCVSRAARRHVTVVLSGDGGDETFGGYDFRYVPHQLEGKVRPFVPGAPGRRLARWLGAMWPRSPRLPRPLRLGNVLENLGRDPAAAYYADLCFLKPWEVRRLLGHGTGRDPMDSPVYEAVTEPYRRCQSSSPLQRAQYADLKVYLPNDPLVKVDRMSMAHGLEVRCPLLDHRIVEFAFRIPTDRKLASLRPKHLLRVLAERRLPAGIASLPKKGFTVPIGSWIAGPYRERYRTEVLGANSAVSSLLDAGQLRSAFAAHCEGRADSSYLLWAVWVLERWLAAVREPVVLDAAGEASVSQHTTRARA
jgi:asparagine synthase (glutamine-hydrolysing)